MRILALVSDLPNPPIGGSRVRNFHLWPAIREYGHEVKVLGVNAFQEGWRDMDEAAANNDGEFFPRGRPLLPVRAFNAALRTYHERGRSPRLAERVDELAQYWEPDVIHAEELRMAYYLPRFRQRPSSALQTVTFLNVESYIHREFSSLLANPLRKLHARLQGWSLRKYESRVVEIADLLFAFSPVDYCRYRSAYPSGRWTQTRNGTDARHIPACPPVNEPKLLVVGALSYVPNARGLLWLLDRVWPHLSRSFSLTVAGSGASPELQERMAHAGVRFVDMPLNLEHLYRESSVCVAPLLEGSGTRGKILEACAYQRLVVTTTRGLEGLDLSPGKEGVIVADDPVEFARALQYWNDAAEERSKLAAQGREAVLKRYDWSVIAEDLTRQWTECAARSRA